MKMVKFPDNYGGNLDMIIIQDGKSLAQHIVAGVAAGDQNAVDLMRIMSRTFKPSEVGGLINASPALKGLISDKHSEHSRGLVFHCCYNFLAGNAIELEDGTVIEYSDLED